MNGRYYDFRLLASLLKATGKTYEDLSQEAAVSIATLKRAATGRTVSYRALCSILAMLNRPITDILYPSPLPITEKEPTSQKILPKKVSVDLT